MMLPNAAVPTAAINPVITSAITSSSRVIPSRERITGTSWSTGPGPPPAPAPRARSVVRNSLATAASAPTAVMLTIVSAATVSNSVMPRSVRAGMRHPAPWVHRDHHRGIDAPHADRVAEARARRAEGVQQPRQFSHHHLDRPDLELSLGHRT